MYNLTCGECLAGLVEKAILSRQTGSLGEAGISDINYEEEFMWGGQGVRMSPGTGTTCPSLERRNATTLRHGQRRKRRTGGILR